MEDQRARETALSKLQQARVNDSDQVTQQQHWATMMLDTRIPTDANGLLRNGYRCHMDVLPIGDLAYCGQGDHLPCPHLFFG